MFSFVKSPKATLFGAAPVQARVTRATARKSTTRPTAVRFDTFASPPATRVMSTCAPTTMAVAKPRTFIPATVGLDLAELHNVRARMQARLGVTATHGLLRAVQIGGLLGLAASTAITLAGPWIHVFGLGAGVFVGIMVGSIIIGLVAQKAARLKYFNSVTDSPEFKRDMSMVRMTRKLLSQADRRDLSGEQNAQLFFAKRLEREVAWGMKEQFAQVLRGFFGENEIILTSKLMN